MVFERKGFAREMVSNCKWCLNEEVELLCKLISPVLKVVFERKGFAMEMVSNCNVAFANNLGNVTLLLG